MREIVFIKDYASKKEGETMGLDSLIASSLVTRKIAKYKVAEEKTVKVAAKKTSKNK